MFYIEKIIHLVNYFYSFHFVNIQLQIIITIQKLVNDEITLKSLSLYPESDVFGKLLDPNAKSNNSKSKNIVENVYLAQLNHLTL